MVSGRLRTNCPTDEELLVLGEDLMLWATEETNELRCRFANWYTERGFIDKEWVRMIDTPVFRRYYEMARAKLALKYLDGSVNPSIGNRLLPYYIPEVKVEERGILKYKSDLNKEESKEEMKNLSDLRIQALAREGRLEQQ